MPANNTVAGFRRGDGLLSVGVRRLRDVATGFVVDSLVADAGALTAARLRRVVGLLSVGLRRLRDVAAGLAVDSLADASAGTAATVAGAAFAGVGTALLAEVDDRRLGFAEARLARTGLDRTPDPPLA